jgi:hypothetical protein
VTFIPRSSIHSGPRIKRVPAKPKKRKKVAAIKVFPDGREKCMTTRAWEKRRLEVEERDDFHCVLCGVFVWLFGEVDHIRKRSLGRDDRMENLRLLCPPCHRKRHHQ